MYDIHVPEHLYAKEIKKLKEAPAKLIDNKDLNSTRRKKEAERLNILMERLQVNQIMVNFKRLLINLAPG